MHSLRAVLLLSVCFPFALRAQSLKPLPTEFVDCVTNKRGVPILSNKQETPLIKSGVGKTAYGEVNAELLPGGGCQNNTTVYMAGNNGPFRPVLRQGGAAKLIFPERAIWEQFKRPCSALIRFNGWVDNQRIGLEVRPFVATDYEGEPDPSPACVKEATMFFFDVATNAVRLASPTGNKDNSHR
jgi:hypothetical protein